MNAVEYLKTIKRLCSSFANCESCILKEMKIKYCGETEYPVAAVEIVKEWAKENPVKTYQDVFLEKFPNAPLQEDLGQKYPKPCVKDIWHMRCPNIRCCDCWHSEYKEEDYE